MAVATRAPVGPSLDELRRIPPFAELDEAALAALRTAVVTRSFAPGQIIFFEGDAAPGVWFVRGGRVRIFKLARDGREQVLCVAHAHACAGCPLFFGGTNPASAEALDYGTLYYLPSATVEALLPAYPQIGAALLRVLAERQRVLVDVATTLVLRCVAARLAQVLLAESGGAAGAAVGLTHAELAQRVGVAREVVSRALSRWSRDGILTCRRGSIVLHDPSALQRHLGGRPA
ncbi:MAG: Crp/Fnr family transcriptional regulator [Chloroflexi bacterium]|nr:Crp/Fnr family transcriptional regulator [Chloroflexota bacterium]